ncbi:MAG: hypothetical protein PHO30_09035 [Candidatus Omnitrophica bacterium]|jgi:hypothetical protein|nr:hypothetical protein [Candidatus Omnitrophota bacterium]
MKTMKTARSKKARYTKNINVGLTSAQWQEIINWADKANLEPSAYMRKIVLDFLGVDAAAQ